MSPDLALPKMRSVQIAAWCAIGMSVIAFVLPLTGMTPRRSEYLYPMRQATAIATSCLAVAALALTAGRRELARNVSLGAMAIALLSFFRQSILWGQLSGIPLRPGLGIPDFAYTAFPNALCFLIGSLAILVLAGRRASANRSVLASIAAAIIGTLGLSSFSNELLRLIPAYEAFGGEISVDSALSIALIGWAIIMIAHARASHLREVVEIKRPVIVAILGTIAAFIVWRSLLQERSGVIAYQTSNIARGVSRALRGELGRRLREVRYLAEEPTPSLFEETASGRKTAVLWTTSRELTPYDIELKELLEQVPSRGHFFYSVVTRTGRPPEVAFVAPLKHGGLRLAVMPLRDVMSPLTVNVVGSNYQLFLIRNGTTILRYPDPEQPSELAGEADFPSPEIEGAVRVLPRSSFVSRGVSWASQMVLAIGLNTSFLLAFSAYLLHVARSRLLEVEDIRSGLEKEIAERRNAQAELARKARQLEASNADLREFAHVTSHDLQEPLRGISGFAQLLARRYKGKFDADADEFLDYITDGAQRMSGMIQGLLLYSRMMHASDLNEPVGLSEAVEWAKANLMIAIEESGAVIEAGPLPVVTGNRLQFGQLMQNLIGNALKYRGPEAPVVRITSEQRDQEHYITIADNGLGIAPELQERIFGLFKRAHGNSYAGAGVGLALCKKIVERHGGRIWVESKPGEGSRFVFTLPVA